MQYLKTLATLPRNCRIFFSNNTPNILEIKNHPPEDTNICSSLVHRSYSNHIPAYMPGSSNDYSSDFADISKQSPAFVDKTYVIKDVIEINRMILTAPPHFGKSVNISMLKYFFEIEVNEETAEPITQFDVHKEPITDTNNYKLFQNLAVHRLHPEIMENWFGKHPVIHMDFSIKTSINSYQDAVNHCKNVVRKAFIQHSYLLKSTKWRFNEDFIIRRYCDDVEFHKLQQSNDDRWIGDISDLIGYLFEHFGRECIFLVDEYDAVFRASLASTDEDTFKSCRHLYEHLIDYPIHMSPDSRHITAVVLSGVSPMAIHGTRDLDLLLMCKFLQCNYAQRQNLLDFHGFTQQEFDFLMDKHNIPADMRQQATEYYGGYCSMKNRDVKYYNPYSVARFLQTKVIQEYWSNWEFFEKYQFLLDIESVDLIIKQLIFERTFKATLKRRFLGIDYLIEKLHDKTYEYTDYLRECLYEQGYLQTVECYESKHSSDCDLVVKIANKEIKMTLIGELKKYYRACGKFDWNSMKACAELFDDIDFGDKNPDLGKIYSLLEKYYNGFFIMNEKNIEVRSYESENEVIEGHLRRLLYNIASLTKHKTTIIDPDKYSRYEKIPINKITPDIKMCSNDACIMIQVKYDTTAQEALNQIILHSSRDETIKHYVLIGLNLSKDKHLSMSAKIDDYFFTYGSENRFSVIYQTLRKILRTTKLLFFKSHFKYF